MRPPKGTRDILPPESERFAALERLATDVFEPARYRRVVTPMFEDTALFTRGIGESTDIVSKEMYTFEDRSGNSLTLRPEGTASVMRAIVSNAMWDDGLPVKLWYSAAMFRYERAQKGRYRQHHQLGIEAVGAEDPALDAEVIELGWSLLTRAGVGEMTLLLNSMGHRECRAAYMPQLKAFLDEHVSDLCADCKRRAETNPLRTFDCKVPADQAILEAAPKLSDAICDDCRAFHAAVQAHLRDAGIPFTPAPRLVRGFDYYTRTTFEYQSHTLDAAQNAVGGGGRYDGLVEQIGGPAHPGIGFGLGIERIMLAQEAAGTAAPPRPVACLAIPLGEAERGAAIALVRQMREAGLVADLAFGGRSLKASMKQANKLGAAYAAIIGSAELDDGVVTMRDMTAGDQETVPAAEAAAWLADRAGKKGTTS